MEDLEDTHFCLKCKATIIGLDNYVSHRKKNCLANQKTLASKPSSEIPTSGSDTQVNDFFTSLELQSTCTLPKNKPEDDNDDEVHQFSEDDEYFPPRTHTGGKWTPGTRPDLTNEQFSSTPVTTSSATCEQECSDKSAELNSSNDVERCSILFPSQTTLDLGNPFQEHFHEKETECRIQGKSDPLGIDSAGHNSNEPLFTHFRCMRCNRNFDKKKDFAIHQFSPEHKEKFIDGSVWLQEILLFQKSLTNVFPFHCHICHFYYLQFEHLKKHIQSYNHQNCVRAISNTHFCHPCKYECQTSEDMIRHFCSEHHRHYAQKILQNHPVIIISKDKELHCSFCPNQKCILRNCKVREKLTLPASGSEKIKCSECGMLLSSDVQFNEHILLEHPECKCCKSCNIVFDSASDFATHMHTKGHKNKLPQSFCDSGRFLCNICHFSTNSEGNFLVHKIQHSEPVVVKNPENSSTNKLTKKFRCSFCNKAFFLSALKTHIFSHTGEKPFSCKFCDKKFTQKGSLQLHMNLHKNAEFHKCEHCSYKTFYKGALRKHSIVHKERQKEFLCEVCGMSYMNRRSLSQHSLIHGHLKYKCQHQSCIYAFRTPSELEQHKTVHSDKKSYLCDTCGYSAKSHHQLKKHQRKHTGEKPFKCTYCSYTSAMSNNILRHLRLHSGSKPYKCPYCNYACNTQENIRKHILKTKKHAGKMMYPCKHCTFACNEFQKYKVHLIECHQELYSARDKEIESSMVAGLYVKDEPRKTIDPILYTPRKKRPTLPRKKADKQVSIPAVNSPVLVINGPVPENIVNKTTKVPVVSSTRTDVLSSLTPLILGSDKEITNEMIPSTDSCEMEATEKNVTDSQLDVGLCAESSGDIFNTIFLSKYVSLPVMVLQE